MNEERWREVEGMLRTKICLIVSKMLDNPDKCGIYPTTKCYDEMLGLFRTEIEQAEKEIEELKGENMMLKLEIIETEKKAKIEGAKVQKLFDDGLIMCEGKNSAKKESK
jgi:hypothetical protein